MKKGNNIVKVAINCKKHGWHTYSLSTNFPPFSYFKYFCMVCIGELLEDEIGVVENFKLDITQTQLKILQASKKEEVK